MVLTRPGGRWLTIAAGWLLAVGALYLWLSAVSPPELREQLKRLQFWWLEGQFVLFALFTIGAFPSVLRAAGLRWTAVAAVVAAAGLAVLLTTAASSRTNRIYFDEHIYQHIGQNLSDLRLAQMCNEGSVEFGILRCLSGEYNKQPYGYPYLLSIGYRIAGVTEEFAFRLNNLAAGGLVVVVGLLAALLFGEGRAAVLAALVCALIPEHLRWSNTAAVEPTAALMCAVAVLAAVTFARLGSTATLLWLVSAAAFAAQFRTESILVLVVVAVVIGTMAPGEIVRPRFWAAGLLGVVLCATLVGHGYAVRDEPWGAAATSARTSMAYFWSNLSVNGPFYFADWRFPALYTGLAAVGLLAGGRLATRLTLALYFLIFWGVFLWFYAGSYNYGADVRYSLMSYAPVAILAGGGLSRLARLASRWPGVGRHATAGAVALLAFQFLVYMPYVRSVGEEAWAARADVDYARQFAERVPPDGIVITQTPSMFLLWHRNAVQTSIAASQPDRVRQRFGGRYAGGVFLHWGFWCNVADPAQVAFCQAVVDAVQPALVVERQRWTYRYALYRVN
jgi:hypothetical protein